MAKLIFGDGREIGGGSSQGGGATWGGIGGDILNQEDLMTVFNKPTNFKILNQVHNALSSMQFIGFKGDEIVYVRTSSPQAFIFVPKDPNEFPTTFREVPLVGWGSTPMNWHTFRIIRTPNVFELDDQPLFYHGDHNTGITRWDLATGQWLEWRVLSTPNTGTGSQFGVTNNIFHRNGLVYNSNVNGTIREAPIAGGLGQGLSWSSIGGTPSSSATTNTLGVIDNLLVRALSPHTQGNPIVIQLVNLDTRTLHKEILPDAFPFDIISVNQFAVEGDNLIVLPPVGSQAHIFGVRYNIHGEDIEQLLDIRPFGNTSTFFLTPIGFIPTTGIPRVLFYFEKPQKARQLSPVAWRPEWDWILNPPRINGVALTPETTAADLGIMDVGHYFQLQGRFVSELPPIHEAIPGHKYVVFNEGPQETLVALTGGSTWDNQVGFWISRWSNHWSHNTGLSNEELQSLMSGFTTAKVATPDWDLTLQNWGWGDQIELQIILTWNGGGAIPTEIPVIFVSQSDILRTVVSSHMRNIETDTWETSMYSLRKMDTFFIEGKKHWWNPAVPMWVPLSPDDAVARIDELEAKIKELEGGAKLYLHRFRIWREGAISIGGANAGTVTGTFEFIHSSPTPLTHQQIFEWMLTRHYEWDSFSPETPEALHSVNVLFGANPGPPLDATLRVHQNDLWSFEFRMAVRGFIGGSIQTNHDIRMRPQGSSTNSSILHGYGVYPLGG